ncbi:hypothetical protein ES708_18232 [subsurface metagenome]
MGNCLNLLNDPGVFLLVATLVVIVLLVWTQLYARGRVSEQARNVHWVMGLVWTYGAMFFTLVAVATLFFNVNLAKGFLILSFLMTAVSILLALLKSGSLIFKPSEESLVGESARRKRWVVVWIALLLGLGFISFYVAGLLGCYFLWAGLALVFLVLVVVGIFIIRASRNN